MTDAEKTTLVGGRYELAELLGRGGMAEVRKGMDTRLGRVVAVKRLRTDLASDPTFQARFRREAQSSASLNHPAIVAVYDTGEEMAPEGIAQPYIVMEYVAGRTLRDVLREGRKILPERALEITSGVLSALDYSHRAGIIHRDIKPGNVMLTPGGDIKVMDFGIARAVSEASSTMTQTAAVVGTAQYLSPEQARGETVDSRSDVYSTGCLLYELLTGRPPFVGDSPVAVAYQHVREQAAPPSEIDPSLPPEIDQIVMQSLAKRVEDRYQSSAAMRSDIERYLAGRPVQAPVVEAAPEPTAVATPAPVTAVAPPTRTPPKAGPEERGPRRAPWIIAIALLLAALVAVSVIFLPQMFEDPPSDVRVPDVVGETEDAARTAIAERGLVVNDRVEQEASEEVPAGSVIAQDPPGDTFIDPGSTVTLTISTGRPEVVVPNVLRDNFEEATANLEALGLVVETEEVDSDETAGTVTETNPRAGIPVEVGTSVTIRVSRGPKAVPELIGLSQAAASEAIRGAGFVVELRTAENPDEGSGLVLNQFPAAGSRQPQGSTVLIEINTYVAPTTPPATTEPPATEPPATEPPADPGIPVLPGG
ncbi:Stk1 family PASTA domain-containing Ser/Thr kinase [Nocardioides alkalitolerans]|uniref:Stk1 family PASTA domain-containing Ser/Thr kinase n=1 Tax=Nocardioides alkalitolerans TaxID=281714 RepID=UPI0003FEE528|nr:Stk1 family PASTA domain-containing Ser/Thr kinase [Nocardioides alkalitolerans]